MKNKYRSNCTKMTPLLTISHFHIWKFLVRRCHLRNPFGPHIYLEASVVHRFHQMVLFVGNDRMSMQLCFRCCDIE